MPHASPPTPASAFPDPIPGVLPFGTVTVVAGAAGVGKTAMLADWIQRWRTGRTICGRSTQPPTAFYYLAADRQWASHQLWFDAVGYPEIPHYSLADDKDFNHDKLRNANLALDVFVECVNKLDPIPGSHLIVDPVSPLFIKGDPNKARDVAVTLLRFSRLCAERQINITATAHFGKQKADPKDQYSRPQDRIAGSGAFAGFSDTQIYLIDPNPPTQPSHTLGWVPRHSAPAEFRFTRDPQTGLFVPYDVFVEIEKRDAVLSCVPKEPTATKILVAAIALDAGISDAQAERYLASLVKDGRVVKIRRGMYQRGSVN